MSAVKSFMILRSQSTALTRSLATQTLGDVAASGVISQSPNAMEWLVVIPDRPNVLERRIAIRPKHSPNFARLHKEGYVSWAGPLFETHVTEGQPRPFKGSAMVINDQSREGIANIIASDVYVQERVWDLEKAQIIPFRTIMRRELLDGSFEGVRAGTPFHADEHGQPGVDHLESRAVEGGGGAGCASGRLKRCIDENWKE